MALRDRFPKTETVDALGGQVVIIPVDYEQWVELQEWVAESSLEEKATKRERTRWLNEFAMKCIQYACPNEELTDDESRIAFKSSGGMTGLLAQKSMAACGHPMEVGTAKNLPT